MTPDADDDVTVCHLRVGKVGDVLELLEAAVLLQDHCFHRPLRSRCESGDYFRKTTAGKVATASTSTTHSTLLRASQPGKVEHQDDDRNDVKGVKSHMFLNSPGAPLSVPRINQ
jgi:hypothetical protein